jgi:hypothetical protein
MPGQRAIHQPLPQGHKCSPLSDNDRRVKTAAWDLQKKTFPRRTIVDGGQRMNPRRWDGRIANHEKLAEGQLTTKLIPPPPYIYFQNLADNF